jgi:hypothetical protein
MAGLPEIVPEEQTSFQLRLSQRRVSRTGLRAKRRHHERHFTHKIRTKHWKWQMIQPQPLPRHYSPEDLVLAIEAQQTIMDR